MTRERKIEREIDRERMQPDGHKDTASHNSSHFIWITQDMAPMIKTEVNPTKKLPNKKIVIGHRNMTSDNHKPPVR